MSEPPGGGPSGGQAVRSFSPRLDVLPQAQRSLWSALAPTTHLGLVLYGGTAIALRLGHRQSVDFDFFTDRPLDIGALTGALPLVAAGMVTQQAPNTLSVIVEGGVALSFFGGIGFGRVAGPERTEDGVLEVASADDLLATKLKVILDRAEARDYRDVAALIASGVRLERGLGAARALFGLGFQPSESLRALTYFEGGDLDTLGAAERKLLTSAAARVRSVEDVRVAGRQLAGQLDGTEADQATEAGTPTDPHHLATSSGADGVERPETEPSPADDGADQGLSQ